jgi:Asp-tRNA(Asn)/Glu-tRNA(Gln) amidotransferase A subunit family amidase
VKTDPEPTPGGATTASPRPAREGGAYTHVRDREQVERELALVRAGTGHAPLRGWTVAVKDLIAVAGRPLRAGSRAREGVAPERHDAPIVAELRRLGGVVVGTTTLHELAFGVTGINHHAGTPVNPRAPDSIPGGSSSGSAVAVAERSARIALGTDTGGSVRIPAALCGVVGFKPAYASYPTAGVLALAPSLDHVGVLAASVADVRAVHTALGHGATAPAREPRIGLIRSDLEDAQPQVAAAIEALLELAARRGCTIVDAVLAERELVVQTSTTIMFAEAAHVHREILADCPELLGDDVRARLQAGAVIAAGELAAARRARDGVCEATAHALEGLDCLIGPTVGTLPPPLRTAAEPSVGLGLVANTRLANLTGIPALSLPLPAGGVMIGLQVMARSDERALAAATWLEALTLTQS